MLTISLMNQKGGAGKSTVARALLSAADAHSMRCAFIDADQTGNLANWAMRAAENGLWSPRIDGYQSIDPDEVEDIFDEIEAEKEIDLLIIDTAGDASRDHDTIATVTDIVLCPILLSKSDLDTARGTANYLFRMRGRAKDPALLPEFRIVLNQVTPRATKGDAELIRTLHTHPLVGKSDSDAVEHMKILPATFQKREAYRTMDFDGLLGRKLARHNEVSQAFQRNPKHLTDAITEADTVLDACRQIAKERSKR